MEIKVGGKYKLGKKIGSGSFGEIYTGTVHALLISNIGVSAEDGTEVAIKLVSMPDYLICRNQFVQDIHSCFVKLRS